MTDGRRKMYAELERCLNHWVTDYSGAIFQTCYSMLHDYALAEDALQDTLIKAWRYIASGENPEVRYEKTWLIRIARNTCKDYLRSGWNRYVIRNLDFDDLPVRMLQAEPDEHGVRLMVLELSETYKQIVLMCFFQGMTQQEIASALGISKTMVHRRLHMAVRLLRDTMQDG